MGIEPTYLAWKAKVLPLNYTRECCVTLLMLMVSSRKILLPGLRAGNPSLRALVTKGSEPRELRTGLRASEAGGFFRFAGGKKQFLLDNYVTLGLKWGIVVKNV